MQTIAGAEDSVRQDSIALSWRNSPNLSIRLTLLHWYRLCHFLPHTAPELGRHAGPAELSVPAAPGKKSMSNMLGGRHKKGTPH